MNSEDIAAYWQSYPDLAELWAKGIWDDPLFAAHFTEHGQPEGRVIPLLAERPENWSDWLYFASQHNELNWWWRKGVVETGVYSAMIDGPESLDKGTIENSFELHKSSSLSAYALAQVAKNAQDFPGGGPLSAIRGNKLEWAEPKALGLLPLTAAIRSAHPGAHGYVILLPWLESGGAELVGNWHYLAAKALGLNPLIILTDQPNITARFAAQEMNILNLPALYEQTMGRPYSHLLLNERAEILTTALSEIRPGILHLIHAFVGYSALKTPATKSRIRAACDTIFVSAFCPHIHPTGNYNGYFRDIPDLVDVVDRFVFDNDWYLAEMAKTYALTGAQSTAIKYPVEAVPAAKPSGKPHTKVLWASRFDSQKNPAIVAGIAALMPDTDFLMYGRQVLGDDQIDWDTMPENVKNSGEFFNIDELPINECFAFLYTSKFDGTPNILLEMASRGLPIVTPDIGGIAGFLGDDWPLYVTHPEDVSGYVAQLQKLIGSDELSAKLTRQQNRILKNERSLTAFVTSVKALVETTKGA